MRIFVIIIAAFIIFWSCSPYKPISYEIKQKLTGRFDSKTSNIQDLIDINGYYQCYSIGKVYYDSSRYTKVLDSIPVNMLFYNDGTFAGSFFFKEGSNEKEISKNFKKNVIYKQESFDVGCWGIYRLKGDTIIVQYLNHAGKLIPWDFFEEWYKVLDRNTLKCIKMKRLLKQDIDTYGNKNYEEEIKNLSPIRFMKADSLPSPNCWLKEEKWLWKDESDWVEYMDNLKKNKKRK